MDLRLPRAGLAYVGAVKVKGFLLSLDDNMTKKPFQRKVGNLRFEKVVYS